MKKIIFAVLGIIISFVLQTTVFKWLSIGNIVPNILIILTVIYGITNGDRFGLITGFFCGLICDIFFGNFIGLNALLYMYIGYINGKFNQNFYPEDIKLPLILIILSDLSYSVFYYMAMFMLRGKFYFSYYLGKIILPEMVYTTIVFLIFYSIYILYLKRTSLKREGGMNFV